MNSPVAADLIGSSADSLFILRLLASFVIGAIWITVITLVAERRGGFAGGFIGGIPTTIVLSLFFVGLGDGTAAAAAAAQVIPYSYCFSVVFIIVYSLLAPRGIVLSLAAAVAAWAAPAVYCSGRIPISLGGGIAIWAGMTAIAVLFFERLKRFPVIRGSAVRYSAAELIFRAAFAGSAIAAAVAAAKFGGPRWGGLGAGFPAVFFSTLILLHRSRGSDFTQGMCRNLILSGMINVNCYAFAAFLAYHRLGIWSGTAAAIAATVPIVYLSYKMLNRQPLQSVDPAA